MTKLSSSEIQYCLGRSKGVESCTGSMVKTIANGIKWKVRELTGGKYIKNMFSKDQRN